MHHLTNVLLAVAVVSAFAVSATEVATTKELQAAMRHIAVHSNVVTVDGTGVTADTFREDADPATLQVVMLTKASDGAAQVSGDDEAIFLHKDTSEKEQQALFTTAFYLKAKTREDASQPAGEHSSP